MKKYILVTVILVLALAGCQAELHDSRAAAYQRWNHARARMLYGVGLEHLKDGQLDQARNKAQEALALDGKYIEARLLLGKVCLEKGDYTDAVAELTKVRDEVPRSVEVIYLLAAAQEKNGALEEALNNYRLAYALDNSNISAVTAAGEVLVAMGRVAEARRYIDGYLGVAKNDPGVFELAGRLAMMSGEYEKAACHYQQAYDLDCKNVPYREALARAQFLARRHEEAAGTLKELTELKGYAAGAWAYAMLGDCYLVQGRPYEARNAFDMATRLKPTDAGVWVNVAKAAVTCRDMERAILAAKQAMDIEPGHLDATLVLGYAMLRTGQPAQAVTVLAQAASAHPSSGTLQCLLGRAYAATGDEPQALRCYAEAVRLEPGNEAARQLLAGTGAEKLSGTR